MFLLRLCSNNSLMSQCPVLNVPLELIKLGIYLSDKNFLAIDKIASTDQMLPFISK